MSHPLQSGLAAAAAAALLWLPVTGAHAATSPFVIGGSSGVDAPTSTVASTVLPAVTTTSSQSLTQVASDFLTQTVNQSPTSTPEVPANPFADAGNPSSSFVQSAPALRNPLSVNLRGNSDLALWNLVAAIKAQQTGNAFDLVDTGLVAVQFTVDTGPVSAVPLPGAAWLLLMGLLGFAGTRVTRLTPVIGDGKKVSDRRESWQPFGTAMPA